MAQDESILLFLRLQDQRRQHRNEGQCQDEGSQHGEGDGERHGLEELALQTGQGEERQEDDDDDQDGERDRVDHFPRRFQHHVRLVDRFAGLMGEEPEAVLHHDHRAVHHHTDANGESRQRHQVGGHPNILHQDESDEHGERQGHDYDHGRADFPEEQEED